MQTEQEKHEVIMKFINEVQPEKFPNLAADDHNVNYFKAILDANNDAVWTIEWLCQAVNSFRSKFHWLQTEKPELSHKEKRALIGLPDDDWRPDDPYTARKKREAAEQEERQKFESDTNNILEVKQKAEDLARTAVVGNHGANDSFRRMLSETIAYRQTPTGRIVDWFVTYRLRCEAYKKRTSGF